jgi:hypothetical protein
MVTNDSLDRHFINPASRDRYRPQASLLLLLLLLIVNGGQLS